MTRKTPFLTILLTAGVFLALVPKVQQPETHSPLDHKAIQDKLLRSAAGCPWCSYDYLMEPREDILKEYLKDLPQEPEN